MTDPASALGEVLTEWSVRTGQTRTQGIDAVYADLRRMAASYLRRERADHTLQATALVHEAYMRVFPNATFEWNDRSLLICSMARAMRQVLIDHARRHRSEKRGSGGPKVALDDVWSSVEEDIEGLAVINQAIGRLEALNERQARVVELRHIVGLSMEETAEVLGVSRETVKLDWRFAKAWLQKELASVYGRPAEAPAAE